MTPAEIVTAFLSAVEDRDLVAAREFLAEEFEMVFPGPSRYSRLEDFVEAAGRRYRWARKRHERLDVASSRTDTVVYVFGTLYGQWLDGSEFMDIRFIDRFVLRDGKLAAQQVWNDLAAAALNSREEGQGAGH